MSRWYVHSKDSPFHRPKIKQPPISRQPAGDNAAAGPIYLTGNSSSSGYTSGQACCM